MKILIIDDNQKIVEQVKSILSRNVSFAIDGTYNGKEGLDTMKARGSYDLVILAILIPKLNGMEVCEAMLQDERLKNIPILLISVLPVESEAFQKSLKKFHELSMVKGVLEKPFSDDDLLARVKKIMEK